MAGEWGETTLGCVADFLSGGTPSKERPEYWGGSIPWVSAKDMKRLRLDDTEDHITGEGLANGTKLVPSGTVFLLARGMTLLHDLPICIAGRPMTFNQDVKALRPKPHIHNDFLPYLLLGNKHRLLSLVDLAGHGTGRLNSDELKALDVLLPPETEQRAIAHILGTLDDKIELNYRVNKSLEAMARTLFKSWFVDFDPVHAKAEGRDSGLPAHFGDLFPDRFEDSELGEIPERWRVTTLSDASQKPQYGYTASANEERVGPKFLRITDINKRPWIEWPSVPYCKITEGEIARYRLARGDILIARMADPGHGVMIEEPVDAVFASYLIRFRPLDTRYRRFIQYWLRSELYWQLVKARGSGTTRVSLNAEVLGRFQFALPPAPIAEAFSSQVGPLRDRLVASVHETETLLALRNALLPRLISGELRVREAGQMLKAAPV